MKHLLPFIFIGLYACTGSSDKSNSDFIDSASQDSTEVVIEHSEPKKTRTSISKVPLNFELNTKRLRLDSTSSWCAGDCWGTVYHYSNGDTVIGLDSMTCGEYGFEYGLYLFTQEQLKLAYYQSSSTLISLHGDTIEFALTERLFDFRLEPTFLIRQDTLEEPNLELLRIHFDQIELSDIDSTKKELNLDYQGTWTMEEDC